MRHTALPALTPPSLGQWLPTNDPGLSSPRDLLDLEWHLLGGPFLLPYVHTEGLQDMPKVQDRGHELQRLNQEATFSPGRKATGGL